MTVLHVSVEAPWGDGSTIHLAGLDLPWGDGSTIHAAPSTYTSGSPPGGGTVTGAVAGAATYTIASRATYDVPHTMVVTDLRDDTAIEVESLTVSIDEDSALWTLRATGGNSLYAKLATGEQPAQVQVNLDGELWVFVVDTVSRSRTFGQSSVSVSGRSPAIAASAPYEADQNWVNDGISTGAQIAAIANLYTGLAVSWEIEDWLVPDRVFSFSGTPLAVVLRVAEAVGAIVQADRTAMGVRVLPRYPLLPNEWTSVSPDVEVAFDAVLSEGFERADRPEYTGVYVSGQQQGVVGFVRLAGTSGARLHPLVTDLLLTEEPALRMRGTAILGASGGQARVTLGLPLLTGAGEPGVLAVGHLVRVLDPDGAWHGLVRSVSVSANLPTVTQTVVLERHTKDIEGSVSTGAAAGDPLVFAGPIGSQSGTIGTPFSLALASYWSGGTTPYAWSLRSGALPAGVTLNASTGVVSGTPTTSETVSVAFRATDATFGMADSNTLEFTVASGMSTIFLDTFTGSDNTEISARSPDIGADWVRSAYVSHVDARTIITSNAAAPKVTSQDAQYLTPVALGGAYNVIATFKIPATQNAERTDVYVYLYESLSGGNGVYDMLGFGVSMSASSPTHRGLFAERDSYATYNLWSNESAGFSLGSTLEMEIRVNGVSHEVYVGGALVHSYTGSMPINGPPTYLAVYTNPGSGIVANSLRLDRLEVQSS